MVTQPLHPCVIMTDSVETEPKTETVETSEHMVIIRDTGLARKSMCFFHKIKDTFFIVTNNFIDLDI